MDSEKLQKLREEVVWASREIYKRGLVNPGEGNVSIRVGKDELLITPSYNQYETITPEEIVRMKFDGTQLSQGRPASTEFKLHKAIYEDRRKAKTVIHIHAPYATVLSVLHKDIPVLMEEQVAFLGGAVTCAEFGAAHTEDLPIQALKALGTKNVALLANHGAIVCGADMQYTVNIATLVEKMAKVYCEASQLGEVHVVPDEFLEKFKTYFEVRATNSRKKKNQKKN